MSDGESKDSELAHNDDVLGAALCVLTCHTVFICFELGPIVSTCHDPRDALQANAAYEQRVRLMYLSVCVR